MNSFQFIWQYIRRYRLRYMAGILTLFFVDFFNIFIPKLTGSITDGLTASSMDMDDIKSYLLALLFLGAMLALGRFFWRYFQIGRASCRERVFQRV